MYSDRRKWTAFWLCFFFGIAGAHRFYLGKVVSGVFQILTLGGFGFWAFIDLIIILFNGMHDHNGEDLAR